MHPMRPLPASALLLVAPRPASGLPGARVARRRGRGLRFVPAAPLTHARAAKYFRTMRLAWFGAALLVLVGTGCSPDSGGSRGDAGSSGTDAGRDGGADAGTETCASDGECDDGHDCTVDTCRVGGTCHHEPVHELCADGERCTLTNGCSSGCENDDDCNDGVFCNGTETCIRGDCFDGADADCDDGNPCTVDSCDPGFDGCRYEVADGCDAGLPPADAGIPCDDFDPSTHYGGTFRFLPIQASDCLSATYRIDELTFSVSGETLRVQAGAFTLTQTPVPTGPDFLVTYTQSGCSVYSLEGTFSCADRFDGTWRANMMDSCSICSNQNASVVGVRR